MFRNPKLELKNNEQVEDMILLQTPDVGAQMQPPPWTFFQNTTLSPKDKPGSRYQLTTIDAEQPLAHSLHSCNPLCPTLITVTMIAITPSPSTTPRSPLTERVKEVGTDGQTARYPRSLNYSLVAPGGICIPSLFNPLSTTPLWFAILTYINQRPCMLSRLKHNIVLICITVEDM